MIFHISDKTQFLHLAGLIQLVTAQGCGCVAPWVNTEENTESQTQTLFPKIPFIWADQEKAKILFLFCIRVGRSRLDCRVGFSGQLEAHFYSVKQADRTVIYVIFDFQVISGNREKREEDRTISVGLISLNSSVTGLSFLSAKLPLKSKDKYFFVFPGSIPLAQTLHQASCWYPRMMFRDGTIWTTDIIDWEKSFFIVFLLSDCSAASSATRSLHLLKNIVFLASGEPVYRYSKERSQDFQTLSELLHCTIWHIRKTSFDTMSGFCHDGEKRSETTFPIKHLNLILMILKTVSLASH